MTEPSEPRELRRRTGRLALVAANSLLALGSSGIFSFAIVGNTPLAFLSGAAIITGGAWIWWCQRARDVLAREKDDQIATLRAELSESTEQATDEHRTRVADVVTRIFEYIQSDERNRHRLDDGATLSQTVLDAALDLIDAHRPRACLYEPVYLEDQHDPDGNNFVELPMGQRPTPSQLRLVQHRGRAGDDPRQVFDETWFDRSGMLKVFLTGQAQLVADTSKQRRWLGLANKQYKTFANVRISFDGRPNGVLSIDACRPNSITGGHIDLMVLFGKLLAIGLRRRRIAQDRNARGKLRVARQIVRPGDGPN